MDWAVQSKITEVMFSVEQVRNQVREILSQFQQIRDETEEAYRQEQTRLLQVITEAK